MFLSFFFVASPLTPALSQKERGNIATPKLFLPADSISIVPAYGGIITKLARGFAEGGLHAEMSAAHTIDEIPDVLLNSFADSLPLFISQSGFMSLRADQSAIRQHRSIESLVKPRAL